LFGTNVALEYTFPEDVPFIAKRMELMLLDSMAWIIKIFG